MVGPVEWEVTRQTRQSSVLIEKNSIAPNWTGLCLIPFPAGVGGESVSQTVRPCSIKYIIVELSLGYIQHILSLHYHGSTATHHILTWNWTEDTPTDHKDKHRPANMLLAVCDLHQHQRNKGENLTLCD